MDTFLFIHPSIHPPVHPPTPNRPSIHPSTHPPPSIPPVIYPNHPSTHPPPNYSSIRPSIHPIFQWSTSYWFSVTFYHSCHLIASLDVTLFCFITTLSTAFSHFALGCCLPPGHARPLSAMHTTCPYHYSISFLILSKKLMCYSRIFSDYFISYFFSDILEFFRRNPFLYLAVFP